MRDASTASAYFNINDKVKVIKNVYHYPKNNGQFSSFGLSGTVVDVWDKCEVDPHCCCAELAFDAPIEVKFEGYQYHNNISSWTAHFALDEIEHVK